MEKEFYAFTLIVNGTPEEMIKLRFVGFAGSTKWLHFVNVKTKENHLCHPDQFPKHRIAGREQVLEFVYVPIDEYKPAKKAEPRKERTRPSRFFSFADYKKACKF